MLRMQCRRKLRFVAALFFMIVFSGCGKSLHDQRHNAYTSYRDIPGVTENEIRDIEALKEKTPFFIYGMLSTTETFVMDNGEIGGFTALFCEWISLLFGIQFKPAIYEWDELTAGLRSYEIDFSGEMTATDERRKTWFMTDPIAERSVKTFRLAGSKPISEIVSSRPLRCGFFEGSNTINDVTSRLHDEYEIVLLKNFNDFYRALKTGKADVCFLECLAEDVFDTYGDVITEDFSPLVYIPVSMTTINPDLQSVISVMQKVMHNSSLDFLINLYKKGEGENRRHKLFKNLSAEEKLYIQNHPVISLASEYDNYPISFFNKHEGEWQGISHDVLSEVEMLTGLTFNITNARNAEWSELLHLLETGEVSMISELLRTEDRVGSFLWPETMIMTDYYALVSKATYQNINISDILRVKVGLMKDSAYAESFRSWFPDHDNIVEYETSTIAFDALERGEVDMVMANVSQLLMLTNYYERTGYKANFVFDFAYESTFGFNKNETILCSIVNKALRLIDTEGISGNWMRKTYDYSAKLARLHRIWLTVVVILFFCVLVLLFFFFQKSRHTGRDLEKLVQKRTAEIYKQHELVSLINDIAILLLESNDKDYLDAMIKGMEIIGRKVNADRVSIWQNSRKNDGRLYYQLVCQWASESLPELDSNTDFAYQDIMPNWEAIFNSGGYVNEIVDNITEPERSALMKFSIKSMLTFPIFLKDEFWGYVSFDDYHNKRTFPETELFILRSWGFLAVGAIKRGEIASDMQNTLTELFRLKRKLEIALSAAKEASRAKSTFLANMSHEIRTPLNAITGMSAIGKSATDIERKDYCFTKIEGASKHLLGVINDILDMSKIEANKFELSAVEFNFEKVLQRAVDVVNFRVDEKEQKLTVQIDSAIPQMLIADDQRLVQVITNLLGNAVKFTPEKGAIRLDTRFLGEEDGLCTIEISVSDTGIGMSAEQQKNLFKSFQQAEADTTRRFGGTGLGLVISRNIVEMMGGKIWVKSESGQGSVFIFTIQAKKGEQVKQRFPDDGVNRSNLRVLVVDDDRDILINFKKIANQLGVYCDTAESGEEALKLAEQNGSYNLYFADWKMPGIDGIELAIKLREQFSGSGSPVVIMISAIEWSAIEDKARNAGIDSFLSKPLFPSTIAGIIDGCLGIERKEKEEKIKLDGLFAGRRILLAEDVEINREIVQTFLEPTKLEIDCAENGIEAVRKFNLAPDKYDLIFMDVQMPEMDGYEATRRIRAIEAERNAKPIPIIAMTANVFREDIEKCASAGMNGHLGKPLSFNDVLEKLNSYFVQ